MKNPKTNINRSFLSLLINKATTIIAAYIPVKTKSFRTKGIKPIIIKIGITFKIILETLFIIVRIPSWFLHFITFQF